MRVAVSAAAALLQICAPGVCSVGAIQYLEPSVQRHVGVVPLSVCKQLIELGENSGFNVQEESIDDDEQKDPNEKYVPSQTIDVYEKGSEPGIDDEDEAEINKAIWEVLQPWIPKITQIVKENRNKEGFAKFYPNEPDREPDLNWIFFRKYSPNEKRNSLKHHHDTNMNTLNIELADDYEGGGLFYIKPLASTGNIDKKYDDMGYEWIDTIKRENTSEIVFPGLKAGDAVFYNYTVEHAVAPVESGTRYSMAFFFDMDNPAVKDDFDDDDDDDEDDELEEGEFEVELRNDLSERVDILVIYDASEGKEVKEVEFKSVLPGEEVIYVADEGDWVRVVKAGTDEVVTEIEMRPSLPLFKISEEETFIEPSTQHYAGILPKSICNQLIELGEKAGFLEEEELIDDAEENFVPAQSVNVYEKGMHRTDLGANKIEDDAEIGDQAIWDVLQPWIPKITQIVKDNRNQKALSKYFPDDPNREPELNWIIIRKYSPEDERNSLKHHQDTNMNTVNIELGDDYEGGGRFYIKPLASTGNVHEEYVDRGYDWINLVKRENSSEIVFPDLRAGDALFHDYTVHHAVAPVESGVRYSMTFFFDMDNPAVLEEMLSEEDDTDSFDVELHNGLSEMDLDIMLVYDALEEMEVREKQFGKVHPNETVIYEAAEGDRLQALRAGTKRVVYDIEVRREQSLYTFQMETGSVRTEL